MTCFRNVQESGKSQNQNVKNVFSFVFLTHVCLQADNIFNVIHLCTESVNPLSELSQPLSYIRH